MIPITIIACMTLGCPLPDRPFKTHDPRKENRSRHIP